MQENSVLALPDFFGFSSFLNRKLEPIVIRIKFSEEQSPFSIGLSVYSLISDSSSIIFCLSSISKASVQLRKPDIFIKSSAEKLPRLTYYAVIEATFLKIQPIHIFLHHGFGATHLSSQIQPCANTPPFSILGYHIAKQ